MTVVWDERVFIQHTRHSERALADILGHASARLPVNPFDVAQDRLRVDRYTDTGNAEPHKIHLHQEKISMDVRDSVELVVGVPLIVVTPALVELAKRMGLPVRYAGLVAMLMAAVLLICGDLAMGGVPVAEHIVPAAARWVLGGIVYGLAAAGLYSQGRHVALLKGDTAVMGEEG